MRTHPYSGPLQGVPDLHVQRLYEKARLPELSTPHAIGLDVFAYLLTESGRPISRALHQRAVTEVPTGIAVSVSAGYFIQVCPRASMSRKGIMVAASLINPDFSGELIISLYNGGFETHYVAHEHRVAQLILTPITRCNIITEPRGVPPPQHSEDVHPGPGQGDR